MSIETGTKELDYTPLAIVSKWGMKQRLSGPVENNVCLWKDPMAVDSDYYYYVGLYQCKREKVTVLKYFTYLLYKAV